MTEIIGNVGYIILENLRAVFLKLFNILIFQMNENHFNDCIIGKLHFFVLKLLTRKIKIFFKKYFL